MGKGLAANNGGDFMHELLGVSGVGRLGTEEAELRFEARVARHVDVGWSRRSHDRDRRVTNARLMVRETVYNRDIGLLYLLLRGGTSHQ